MIWNKFMDLYRYLFYSNMLKQLFNNTHNTFCPTASTAIIFIKISSAYAIAHVFHYIDAWHPVSCRFCVVFRVSSLLWITNSALLFFLDPSCFDFLYLLSQIKCVFIVCDTHINIVKNMKWKWTNNLSSYFDTAFRYFYRE